MKKKILVVDDDSSDLALIKKSLEKDYDVELATNGAEAIDFINNIKFNLILIDIKMPTLSGYDLLRLMRERLDHKVKMIYVSIVPKKSVDLKDVDGFVQKPFSPAILLKEVKKILK